LSFFAIKEKMNFTININKMKRILFFLFALMALGASAQVNEIKFSDDTYLLRRFDLSAPSGDTAIVFRFKEPPTKSWSMSYKWYSVTGVGLVSLEVCDFDELTPFIPYVDDMSKIITGTTGGGGWEDSIWSWKYFRLVIEKGTLSAGYLDVKLNYFK